MSEDIQTGRAALQEVWGHIETALAEAMERYDFSIPPNVRVAVRATFSVSTLGKSGILTQQDVKLFHDIRSFKDGNTTWTREYNVLDSAWLLVEYIREA